MLKNDRKTTTMHNMSGQTHNIVMNFTQNEAPGQCYNFRQEQLNNSSMSNNSKNKRKKSNPQHPSYQVRKFSNKKKSGKCQPPNKQSTNKKSMKQRLARKLAKKKNNKTLREQNNSEISNRQNTSRTSNKQNCNKIYKRNRNDSEIQKQKVVTVSKKNDKKLKLKIQQRKFFKKNKYNEKSRSFQYRKNSNVKRREEFNDNSYYGCHGNSYQSIKEYNFPGDFMPLNYQYDPGEIRYFNNMSQNSSQNNNGLFGNQHRQIVNCYINFSQPYNNSRADVIPSLLNLPYNKPQGSGVIPSSSSGNPLLMGESLPGCELQIYNNYQMQFENLPIENNSGQYYTTVNQELSPDDTNMGRTSSEEFQGSLEDKDDNGNKAQNTGVENREVSEKTGAATTDNSRNNQNSTEIKNENLQPSSSSVDQNNVANNIEYNADVENFLAGKFEVTDSKIFLSADETENQTNCNETDSVLERESESLFLIDKVGDQQNIFIFNDPLPESPVKLSEKPENSSPNKTYPPVRYWNTDQRQLNICKPPRNQSNLWRNPAYKKNDQPVVFDMQKIKERVELEVNKRNLNKPNVLSAKSDIVLNVSNSENLNLYDVEEFVETYSSSDEEVVVENQVSESVPEVLCLDSDTDSSVCEVPLEPAPLIVISDDEDNSEKTNDEKEDADIEIALLEEKDIDPSDLPSVENNEQNVDRADHQLFTLPASTPKKQSSKHCPSPSDSDDFIQNDLSTIDQLNSERHHSKSKPSKKCSKKKSHKKSKTSNFSVMDVYDTESTCSEVFEGCLNTSCESLAQVSNPAITENSESSKVNKKCDEMDISGFEKLISPIKKASNQKKVNLENKNSEDNFVQTETKSSDPSVSMMFETCIDFTPVKTKVVNMRRTNSDTSVSSESSLASIDVTVDESFKRTGKKKKQKKRNTSFNNENEFDEGVAERNLKQSEKKSNKNKSNLNLELASERKKSKNKNVSSIQSEDSCDETISKKKKRKHKNSISEDPVEIDLCNTSDSQKHKKGKKDKTKAQEVPLEHEDESRAKKKKIKQNACSSEVEESKGCKNKSSKDLSVASEINELCHSDSKSQKNKKKANKRRSLSENSVIISECDDSICVSEIENSDVSKKGKKKKHKKKKEESSDVYENTEILLVEQENNNSVSSNEKLKNKNVASTSGVSTENSLLTVSKLNRKRKHKDSLMDVSTSSKNDEIASHGPLSDVLYNTNESLSDFRLHSEVGFTFDGNRQIRPSSVHSGTDSVFVFGANENNVVSNVVSNKDRALDARMRLKTYWTADLQKFYNTSWGSLSYDLKKELEEMRKKPYKEWSVLQSDHSHSYGKRTPHCTNCRQLGHMRWQCKKPYHNCWMCSSFGHSTLKCPEGCCLNCGKKVQKGTFITSCGNCFTISRCTECRQTGHTRNRCPDFWRRYHKTVSVDIHSTSKNVGNTLKNNKERWCSVCAGRWHTPSECLRASKNLEFQPNFPSIVNYKNAYRDEPSNKRFKAVYNTKNTWSIHNIDYDTNTEIYVIDGNATFELRKEEDIDVIEYASNEVTKKVLNDEKISSKICKIEPVSTFEELSDFGRNADGMQINFGDDVSEKSANSRITDSAEKIHVTDNTEKNNKTSVNRLQDDLSDEENEDVLEISFDSQLRTCSNNDGNTSSSEKQLEAISLESSSDDDIVEIQFREDVIEIDLSDEDGIAENSECFDSSNVSLTTTQNISPQTSKSQEISKMVDDCTDFLPQTLKPQDKSKMVDDCNDFLPQTSKSQDKSKMVDDCNDFLNLNSSQMKKISSIEGKELLKHIEKHLKINCQLACQNNRSLLLITGQTKHRQLVRGVIRRYLSNRLELLVPEKIINSPVKYPKKTKNMANFLNEALKKFHNLPNYRPQEIFDRMKDSEYKLKFRFLSKKSSHFFLHQLRRHIMVLNIILFAKGGLGEGHKHLLSLQYYIDSLNDLDKRNISKIPEDLLSSIKMAFEYIFTPRYRDNYSELINTFERTYNDFYDSTVKLDDTKWNYYKHMLIELIRYYKVKDPVELNKFRSIKRRLIDDLITERDIIKINQQAAALKINTTNIPQNSTR